MAETQATEKKWLIKSSGKILGPYTFEEVAIDLGQRKISMIDEVRSPEDRWLFIRENPQFAEVVQRLREQLDLSKEDTSTTYAGTRSITQELTPPPSPSILQENSYGEMTPTPPGILVPTAPPPEPPSEKPITEKVVQEKPTAPMYVSTRDPRMQKRVAKERRETAFLGWLLLVGVIIGVVAFQLMPKKEVSRALGFEDLIRLARSSKSIGQYEKALEFFRKAETMHVMDASLQLQMVPLLMMVENQNVQARQILENISRTNLEAKARQDVESFIALSYLREARLDEAQKRYNEIVRKYPENDAAKINLVEISLLQGQFEAASDRINELVKAGMKEPILFLFRILTIYRTTEDATKLESAKSDLKRLLSQYQDYRNEMFLLLAALQKKLNQDLDVGDSIKSMLETDPDLTRKHIHDPFVHTEVLEWGYLGNICEILVKEGGQSPIYKGLTVYCTYQQGDIKQALDQIERARNQFANDASLIGMHSFLLAKSGRNSEAKAVLQLPKAHDTNLAESVKASMCESQKDWWCAEESWKRVLQKDSRYIGAYAGLARVALERGQHEMANDFLKQGMLISNQYQPFLELKDRINER